MELVSGRPQNTEGRLGKEIRTYDFWILLGFIMKEWIISRL